MGENKMKIVLNGKQSDYGTNFSALVKDVIVYQSKQYEYQSFETIFENIGGIMDLFYSGFEMEQLLITDKTTHKEIISMKKRINRFLKNYCNINNKEKLIHKIYDFVLSIDGLSNLHGFGQIERKFV